MHRRPPFGDALVRAQEPFLAVGHEAVVRRAVDGAVQRWPAAEQQLAVAGNRGQHDAKEALEVELPGRQALNVAAASPQLSLEDRQQIARPLAAPRSAS
jgi:hypothetical protein